MQSVQKNRETKVEEMNKIKFYGIWGHKKQRDFIILRNKCLF